MRTFALAIILAGLALPAMGQPPSGQGMAQSGELAFCRVLMFQSDDTGFSIPLQYQFTYGQPTWKDGHEAALTKLVATKRTMRWRFGTNAWTTFDTNRKLTIGDKTVEPGFYYCCIEHAGDGKISLILLDPKSIRTKRLDAFQVSKTTGGIKIPLTMKKAKKATEKLNISFTDTKDASKSTLNIAWGPRTLTAAIKVL